MQPDGAAPWLSTAPTRAPAPSSGRTLPSRTDASPTDAPWNPLGAHRNHFFLLNSLSYGPGAARSMLHNVPWGCGALGILHCCGELNNLSSQNPGGQSLKPRCDREWGGYAPRVLLLWAGCAPRVLLGPPRCGQGVLPRCSWAWEGRAPRVLLVAPSHLSQHLLLLASLACTAAPTLPSASHGTMLVSLRRMPVPGLGSPPVLILTTSAGSCFQMRSHSQVSGAGTSFHTLPGDTFESTAPRRVPIFPCSGVHTFLVQRWPSGPSPKGLVYTALPGGGQPSCTLNLGALEGPTPCGGSRWPEG